MAQVKVLFTGATGYIGGSVLTALTTSQNPIIKNGTKITALVRKQEQVQVLEKAGVSSLLFNGLDDIAQMENLAKDHDMVIHTASTLHTETIEAMVAGLGARKKDTGRDVFFIHVRTGSMADRPITGSYVEKEDRIFSDKSDNFYAYLKSRQAAENLPVRRSDVAIIEKGRALNVLTYILMSPLVYGIGTGLFNKQSIQIPAMVRGALQAGRAEVVGDGRQRWGNVHVVDLGRLYVLFVERVLERGGVPAGERGVYFTIAEEHQWVNVAEGIGRVGRALGVLETEDVRSVSLEDGAGKWLGGNTVFTETVFASNARARSDLALELGWKPEFDGTHLRSAIEEDMKVILGLTKI